MEYCEMQRHYPWIEELFSLLVGWIVNEEKDRAQAMAMLRQDHALELARISDRHLPAVIAKLTEWAMRLDENNNADRPVERPAHPEYCPYCAGDVNGGVCTWCHSDISDRKN